VTEEEKEKVGSNCNMSFFQPLILISYTHTLGRLVATYCLSKTNVHNKV